MCTAKVAVCSEIRTKTQCKVSTL